MLINILTTKLWMKSNLILVRVYSNHSSILERHMGNYNYWRVLGNIGYMSQFYELFYQICNKIHEYNTNGGTINDIGNITTKCSQAYTKIYNKVDKCDPYINLLNNFKKTYDNFRYLVIMGNTINN
ncbi:hypothetical protein YYC_00029 [Plasmodium yoelii 17X]|uniref:Plasmodium variant antigen protein Cir/Yir/Bir n=1 Tax=Plasmodium yoelii 17X TaxID=1323249 RepID=V7PWJ3_PLAYE|nr:hypothetical protein YYC_00029 [Plasmodium yoelii 17X]